MVVQDAYKLLPLADAMYGCNPSWWRIHQECKGFLGEKWSTHETTGNSHCQHLNDKSEAAEKWGVNLVKGRDGAGFSFDPDAVHYGSNSGFQAINLALLFGSKRIVLVGFDMRYADGKSHFFGDHPSDLHQNSDEHYRSYIQYFDDAAKRLPKDVSIVNATPGSALRSFPMVELETAIAGRAEIRRENGMPHSDRAIADVSADRASA